jgi:hypothetical protein
MPTLGIDTFLALPGHEQWPLHGLHLLSHMPGLAGHQGFTTVDTFLQFTLHNHSLCVREAPVWTISRLFTHLTPPATLVAPIVLPF